MPLNWTEQNEFEWSKACANGDRAACKALYDQHKAMLFGVCLRYAYHRAEAEDLLQEGFVKIFRDLHQWRGEGPLGAWLRRVVLNVALAHLRKSLSNSTLKTEEFQTWHEGQQAPAELWEPNATGVVKLMNELPTGYRIVLNLFVIEEYSHEEIAQELGISVGTSKSQLSRAKELLRKKMESALTV